MFKAFFQVWPAIQQLLTQVIAIRGKVYDDADIILRSLEVYKRLLSWGLTDKEIDYLITDYIGKHYQHITDEVKNSAIR